MDRWVFFIIFSYAPKGVGALYIRDGIENEVFLHGAGQENGRRAGTENVLGIVGLGKACEIAVAEMERHAKRMQEMRDRLEEGLAATLTEVRFNGHLKLRLPNTCKSESVEHAGILTAFSATLGCVAQLFVPVHHFSADTCGTSTQELIPILTLKRCFEFFLIVLQAESSFRMYR
jgi:cysteine desulfurase